MTPRLVSRTPHWPGNPRLMTYAGVLENCLTISGRARISTEKATYPLRVLCRALRDIRIGFYAWQRRPLSATRVGMHAVLRRTGR